MKTFLICFVFLYFLTDNISGQTLFSFKELRKAKKYKSLEEALENPEEVYVLLLQEQNLVEVPLEILQFKHLQYLSLAGNPIKEIPSTMSELKELQYLHLPHTEVDNLPDTILNMPSLKHISLIRTPLSEDKEKMKVLFEKSVIGDHHSQFWEPFDRTQQVGVVSSFIFNPQQSFGELGMYWSKLDFFVFRGVSVGVEWNPRTTAYKAGLIFNALLSFQLHALILDNHKEQTFALRPEVGFGLAYISFTYGNTVFIPKDFENAVRHQFTLRLALPVWQKNKKWYKGRVVSH